MSTFSHRTTLAAFATAVILAAAAPASATTYRDASPGAACHPANAGAAKFVSSSHTLTNNNTTTQYVICHLPLSDASTTPVSPSFLQVEIQSGGPDSTVLCVAQTGYYAGGTLFVRSSASRSYTFVTQMGTEALVWGPGVLVRQNVGEVLTLTCRMDPFTKLGLIQFSE
jgi:hypothetical protein